MGVEFGGGYRVSGATDALKDRLNGVSGSVAGQFTWQEKSQLLVILNAEFRMQKGEGGKRAVSALSILHSAFR